MLSAELTGLFYEQELDSPVAKVVRALSGHGSVSTSQIVRATGLARSTVSTILSDLKRSQLVIEVDARNSGPGRPAMAFSLRPEAGTCVGALLGEKGVRIIVADVAHNVVADITIPLDRDYAPAKAARVVRHLIEDLYNEHSLAYAGLLGIGFAVSSPLTADGHVMRNTTLPTWKGVDLKSAFEPTLQKPIFAANESHCAALAEMMWGAATDIDDFVLIKLDRTVSGAIVVDGKILVGSAGAAGQLGHIVFDPQGPLCRCGNRGCLELYCGAGFVEDAVAAWAKRPLSITEIVKNAIQGDVGFQRLLADAGEAAGRGLSTIGVTVNPPLFVIAGSLASAGELLLEPLRASYEKHAFVKTRDIDDKCAPRFVAGQFLDNDSCMGAVGLVLRHSSRL